LIGDAAWDDCKRCSVHTLTGIFAKAQGISSSTLAMGQRLIDLERLVELRIEFYPKLDDLARGRLPLAPICFVTPKG
jgi:hypothetical protein